MGHVGALPIFLKIPEHIYVIGIWGINAWEEFGVHTSDEGHRARCSAMIGPGQCSGTW